MLWLYSCAGRARPLCKFRPAFAIQACCRVGAKGDTMSAARSKPMQRQQGRVAFRPIVLMLAAWGLTTSAPILAEDDLSGSKRVASIGDVRDVQPFRLGMPPRPAAFDVDLKVLLVQNRPLTKTDAAVDDETILVAVALSVPQSVDDDIAKQYDLAILERIELP